MIDCQWGVYVKPLHIFLDHCSSKAKAFRFWGMEQKKILHLGLAGKDTMPLREEEYRPKFYSVGGETGNLGPRIPHDNKADIHYSSYQKTMEIHVP